MQFFTKKHKGFTLIELLVVIAIIGILASIVLVSLGGARNKAKDARIIADMSQFRTQSEIVLESDGDYGNVACTGGDASIGTLCTDVADQGDTSVTIAKPTDNTQYCAFAKLLAPTTATWYCVDNDLVARKVTTDPAGANLCGATTPTYNCPAN